jgi:hypothetical protein
MVHQFAFSVTINQLDSTIKEHIKELTNGRAIRERYEGGYT